MMVPLHPTRSNRAEVTKTNSNTVTAVIVSQSGCITVALISAVLLHAVYRVCPVSAACFMATLQALLLFSMLQAPVGQLPAVQLSATAQHFADLLC